MGPAHKELTIWLNIKKKEKKRNTTKVLKNTYCTNYFYKKLFQIIKPKQNLRT